jgi:hypothetical protein
MIAKTKTAFLGYGISAALAFGCVARAEAQPLTTQSPEQQAHALFDQGKALRDAGKYEEACAKFESARTLFVSAGTVLSVADCRERFDRLNEARELYETVVQGSAGASHPEQVTLAKERIAVIDTRLAAEASAKPTPPAPKAVPPAGAGPRANLLPGVIVLSAGGGALFIGTVLGGVALHEFHDATKDCTPSHVCPPTAKAPTDSAVAKAKAADAFFVIGTISAAVGVVLLVTLKHPQTELIKPSASGVVLRF